MSRRRLTEPFIRARIVRLMRQLDSKPYWARHEIQCHLRYNRQQLRRLGVPDDVIQSVGLPPAAPYNTPLAQVEAMVPTPAFNPDAYYPEPDDEPGDAPALPLCWPPDLTGL